MAIAGASKHDISFHAREVSISRGGVRIVENISLSLAPGEVVILRGPNGAGKTTLLRAFAGLLKTDSGEISVRRDGGAAVEDPQAALIHCGPANAVKSALTVDENLKFWAALYGASAGVVAAARKAFHLDKYAGRNAGVLSTGLARRLGLARLLIANRAIWFVDEPTASLDRASAAEFTAMVEAHCANGGAALIATHDALEIKGARNVQLSMKDAA